MRTFRIRTAALATVTAALALGLTACGGADGGSKAAGGDKTAGTSQSRSASDGDGKGGAEQAKSGGDAKRGERSTTASGGSDEVASKSTTAAQQCRGDEMMVTAVHQLADQQGDHLLITASNEGDTPCWVTSYPSVKLGDDEAVLPHSKKDNPGGDQRITLQPGGTAYSAVNLFDYGSDNQTAQSFAIALRGADGHDGPFYSVDSKGDKPQFRWNEADVLNWSTEKPYDF
ncbi:DUF4232 domain-containing protein [Streptomyces violaceusniger]|uniref:DUF4232 domain-containing protein n=1 Tax=Streptomyces violaceusniger (strain Tu 4113) TaxID=653045 RepID=G2NVP8_STRV4|nr:DUF4232 domain-containing protein [Streptomyces violaceusniger]AEM85932.1 hypothetical protein Strvi_6526 [Streptomyces violaceusniger Tu 4113]